MKKVLIVFLSTTLYATLRYNVFKGVAWAEWPVYTLNKAFALSALFLFLIDAIRRRRGADEAGVELLRAGWILMLMHVGVSLAILTPAYHAKYFLADKLTWQAGWSMMIGVVSAAGIHKYTRHCVAGEARALLATIGVLAFLSGAHAALLGYGGWFQPKTWPGYIIHHAAIPFVAGCLTLAMAIRARPDRR